jgi:hypothetical protein
VRSSKTRTRLGKPSFRSACATGAAWRLKKRGAQTSTRIRWLPEAAIRRLARAMSGAVHAPVVEGATVKVQMGR